MTSGQMEVPESRSVGAELVGRQPPLVICRLGSAAGSAVRTGRRWFRSGGGQRPEAAML